MESISVFIPARNEEKNIQKCIEEIDTFLKKRKADYEIIIVNDGSTDRTSEIIKQISDRNHAVIMVNTNGEKGYGAAVRKGIAASSKSLIFFTDADLQYDILDLDKLLTHADQDYVVGCRKEIADTFLRRLYIRIFSLISRLILGMDIPDVACDFKLLRASSVKTLHLVSNDMFVHVELLYKMKKHGARGISVPVGHYERKFGKQDRKRLVGIYAPFMDLVKLKLNLVQ